MWVLKLKASFSCAASLGRWSYMLSWAGVSNQDVRETPEWEAQLCRGRSPEKEPDWPEALPGY